MRSRLRLAIPIPAVFLGMSVVLLAGAHPAARGALAASYAAELAACAACALALHWRALARHVSAVALVFGGSFAVLMAVTCAILDLPPELLALSLVCELTGLSVLLPWGVRWQIALSGIAVLAIAAIGPFLSHTEMLALSVVGVVAGATSAIAATHLLARFRDDARWHATLLELESRRKQDELDVSSALLRVSDALGASLGDGDAFGRVARLAVEALACDWSVIFFLEPGGRTLRAVGHAGLRREVADAIATTGLQRGIWRLGEALDRGELVEIADVDRQDHAPSELLRRLDVAAVLCAPIMIAGELVGVVFNGDRGRTGPFTHKQRRVTLGLAQALAVAVANQRLVADLRSANRLKSDFVSTMSHELRTPLNVMTGYAEILCDEELGALSPEHRTAAHGVERSARELFDLVTKTLDLSRLEAGGDVVALERVVLGDVFAEVQSELATLLAPGRVALSYEEDASAPIAVLTDRGKLKTIVKNLVGNAIKFTPAGSVRVSASLGDGRLRLRVVDTGIGIASEDLGAIFDMFRQLPEARSASSGGVGLGLYIVKRLVDVLGGSIAVASTPGVGSEFTLELPTAACGEASPANPSTVGGGSGVGERAGSASGRIASRERALAGSRRAGYKRGP